jgi:hypothetical protein
MHVHTTGCLVEKSRIGIELQGFASRASQEEAEIMRGPTPFILLVVQETRANAR